MMTQERTATGGDRHGGVWHTGTRWGPVLPFLLVVASLLAGVLILVGLERRTASLLAEVADVAEPARAQVHDLKRLLALEMAAKRGFLLTGDPEFLDKYRDLVRQEGDTFGTLAEYARGLGPAVEAPLQELRSFAPQWHAHLPDVELRTGVPNDEPWAMLLPEQHRLYEETLRRADLLDQAIRLRAEELRSEVHAIERREQRLVVVLGILALAAAAVVFKIGWQMRELAERSSRLAAVAEARRRELEHLMEEKASFIRGLAHDLKNPLGAVDGYAQLLEAGVRGPLSLEQQQTVARIRGGTRQMLAILEDLLLLSTLTEGRLRVSPQLTDVVQLVGEVVEDHHTLAQQKALHLSVEPAPVLPPVTTDPARLRQVLGNLLSNAIKYTSHGTVTVRVFHRNGSAAGAPQDWIGIEIVDTGLGIPLEEQERVFEEFHRLHPAEAQGTGLGLAISRRLMRLLGGELTLVHSEVDVGSTFALWLPGVGASSRAEPLPIDIEQPVGNA
jgi:signal transduction histidine kinase